jgi:hypothetical protein
MKKPPMFPAGNAPRRGPAVRIPMSDCLGEYSEQRVIYGPTVATPELHNKPGDTPGGVGGVESLLDRRSDTPRTNPIAPWTRPHPAGRRKPASSPTPRLDRLASRRFSTTTSCALTTIQAMKHLGKKLQAPR